MTEEMPPQPTDEEIRAALEEQLRNLRVEDVILQTIATLINVAVMRLGLAGEGEKDPAQAKMAIDAARALMPITPPEQAAAVQDALSQVQMAYAQEAQAGPSEPEPATEGEGPAEPQPPQPDPERERARSKLWTPPGT